MHLACVLGMIFPVHELSTWKGGQGQFTRKKCGPNALKAFFRWLACVGSCTLFLRRGLVGWSRELEQDVFGIVLKNKICVSHAGVS